MKSMNKIGLLVAALMVAWHLSWLLLVATGIAQPFLDLVFWAHMIDPVYRVRPFDLTAATALILITAALGYFLGAVGFLTGRKLTATARA
jgi:hypothetical protein